MEGGRKGGREGGGSARARSAQHQSCSIECLKTPLLYSETQPECKHFCSFLDSEIDVRARVAHAQLPLVEAERRARADGHRL